MWHDAILQQLDEAFGRRDGISNEDVSRGLEAIIEACLTLQKRQNAELLEALTALIAAWDADNADAFCKTAIPQARAAIAKAEDKC